MERDLNRSHIQRLIDRINSKQRKLALWLPSTVTFLRLTALPALILSLDAGLVILADFLFLLTIFSDLLDGYLARRLQVCSRFGADFDACIDFLFIGGVFLYFTVKGIYPAWVLVIIVVMFAQFLVTSRLTGVVFDPFGKYYGSLLYGAIGLTILFPEQAARDIIMVAFVGVSAASLSSRLIYYVRKSQKFQR